MLVTDGVRPVRAHVRTDDGWVAFPLLPGRLRVPAEDGLIVLRARGAPLADGAQPAVGDVEFIGVYSQALVRVAVRFAEVNDVAVVLHWREVPAGATALAVAVAGWLRDTRAAAGTPAAVVTSAARPRAEGGFVVVPHVVRPAGEPATSVWELRPREGLGAAPGDHPAPRPDSGREHSPGPTGPPGETWAAGWIARPRHSGGPSRVIRPGRVPDA